MVSRDFIKYHKRELRIRKIKGDMLKEWIKNDSGVHNRKKLLLVPNSKITQIKNREIEEIVAIIKEWKYKNQEKFIKRRIPVADRRHINRLGVELSSYYLKKLLQIFIDRHNSYGKNDSLINYLKRLIQKKIKEETNKRKHTMSHNKKIKALKSLKNFS